MAKPTVDDAVQSRVNDMAGAITQDPQEKAMLADPLLRQSMAAPASPSLLGAIKEILSKTTVNVNTLVTETLPDLNGKFDKVDAVIPDELRTQVSTEVESALETDLSSIIATGKDKKSRIRDLIEKLKSPRSSATSVSLNSTNPLDPGILQKEIGKTVQSTFAKVESVISKATPLQEQYNKETQQPAPANTAGMRNQR